MHSAESPSLSEPYAEGDLVSYDERIQMTPEDSNYDERLRWPRSSASYRGSVFENNRASGKRRSLGNRVLRAMARFVVAVLIGVGATLSWQAYGDQARAMIVTWAPSLAWLGPVPATQETAATALSSADLAQQLKPVTLEIAAVRHGLEQLAAEQNQLATNQGRLAQGLSTLQAVEQEVGLKIASMAQPKPKPVHVPPRPPAPRPLQPPDGPDGQ